MKTCKKYRPMNRERETNKQTGVPCATSLPEQMGATLHSVCWKAASTWRLPLPQERCCRKRQIKKRKIGTHQNAIQTKMKDGPESDSCSQRFRRTGHQVHQSVPNLSDHVNNSQNVVSSVTFIHAFYTLSDQKMGSQEKEREGPRERHKDEMEIQLNIEKWSSIC